MTRILVTGAGGFVGRALVRVLLRDGYGVRGAVRQLGETDICGLDIECIPVGNVGSDTDWSAALRDVDTVVHLVARTHSMHERSHRHLALYREVNVGGTVCLAEQAVEAGVRRFVFVSS